MANPIKGEHAFEAIGQTWTAVMGFTALCQIEAVFDAPVAVALEQVFPEIDPADLNDPQKVAKAIKNVRVGSVAKVMKGLLLVHHPDVDELTIGAIADDIGVEKLIDVIKAALQLGATPTVEIAENPTIANRPKKRTGSR